MTEPMFGQLVAQALQLKGSLARVGVLNATGEQIGIIGEDLDAFPRPRNPHIKTLATHGCKRPRQSNEESDIDGFPLGRVRGDLVGLAESLAVMPRRGGQLRARPGVRRLVHDPYLVTYRIDETQSE